MEQGLPLKCDCLFIADALLLLSICMNNFSSCPQSCYDFIPLPHSLELYLFLYIYLKSLRHDENVN